jgi:hypothetical protein
MSQDLGKELINAENTLDSAPTYKMANLSIAQLSIGIQGDLKRFLEAY